MAEIQNGLESGGSLAPRETVRGQKVRTQDMMRSA